MAAQESATKGVSLSGALPSAAGIGSPDYSQTNIQVAGVDEPDFVKNDPHYIYVISGSTLTIVDAYPAKVGCTLPGNERNLKSKKFFCCYSFLPESVIGKYEPGEPILLFP